MPREGKLSYREGVGFSGLQVSEVIVALLQSEPQALKKILIAAALPCWGHSLATLLRKEQST